jgi:hypothetical protein
VVSLSAASENEERRRSLRRLMSRSPRWSPRDLSDLFDLAYTNGRAAKIRKPSFLRQAPGQVARSIAFLLNPHGDPYTRFEKLVAPASPFKLDGFAESGVAYLMHVWDPDRFAVVNQSVEKAFKVLKIKFPHHGSKQLGRGYRDRNTAIAAIAKKTGLETFARVDHFLDAIGKGHIGSGLVG